MSKKSFIDSVEVREPCPESWEMMTGTDKIRFCSHCAKDVNNISEMTRKEAVRLVRSAGPNLCIRYIPDPNSRPMFAEQLYKITRRTPGLTAGVMTASLSLATLAYGQNEKPGDNNVPQAVMQSSVSSGDRPAADQNFENSALKRGSIEGVIRDLNGKPVPGMTVEIYAGEYSRNDYTETDAGGRFRFAKVEPGQYGLKIGSSSGPQKAATHLTVFAGQTLNTDFNVSAVPETAADGTGVGRGSGSGFGGAMAAIEYSTPLARAVADNDAGKVRELINAGAKVNAKDKNYDNITPLFVAVENGNLDIVRMLLDAGARINAVNKTKQTPLMFIDSDATPQLIEMLVRAGADINAQDDDGATALLNAVTYSPTEVVKALIDAGADIEKADNDGTTPLIRAAGDDDAETVKVLIMAGAVVNARNTVGESAWDKTSDPEIESMLEDYGAAVRRGIIEVTVPATAAPK